MSRRTRVGIIGASPERGWAAQAHIPALKSLSDDFEITALSTSRRESADVASKRFGVPLAFDHHQELVNNDAVEEKDGKWIDKGPKVRAGFVAKTRINRHDFGVSWNDVVDKGGVVVGNMIDITIDAEAILEAEDEGARRG